METPGNIKRASKSKLSQEHLWTLPSSGTFRSSSSKFIIDSWTETCSKLSCTIIRFLSFSQNKLAYRRRQLTTDQINFRKWASHRKVSDSIFFFLFLAWNSKLYNQPSSGKISILKSYFDLLMKRFGLEGKLKRNYYAAASTRDFLLEIPLELFIVIYRETGCICHLYTNA